ncbi:MAG TPA: hypothetical protein DCK87_09560 [Desulfotomaculum sp.]|nr:hypothetical protein [Desulfotomaculum sp.]
MSTRLKNVTFSLPVDIVEKLRKLVKDKYISSLNAGAKEALEEYTKRLEKQKFKTEMMEASKDPLFLKDIEKTMTDFENLDKESSGRIQEW